MCTGDAGFGDGESGAALGGGFGDDISGTALVKAAMACGRDLNSNLPGMCLAAGILPGGELIQLLLLVLCSIG